jgi:hypothetical protein
LDGIEELVVEDDLSMSWAAGAFPFLTRSRSSALAIAKFLRSNAVGALATSPAGFLVVPGMFLMPLV